MKTLPFILTISAVLTLDVNAQLGLNATGNVGLSGINTPESLGKGKKAFGLIGRYSQFGIHDPRGEIGEVLPALAYGISDRFDAAIMLPFITVTAGQLSLGKLNVSVKYNFLNRSVLAISALSHTQIPVQKSERYVRTMHTDFQFELSTMIEVFRPRFYFNLGYGARDYLNNSMRRLETGRFILFNGGVTYKLDFPAVLFLEGLGYRSIKNGDDDLYFQLGCILYVNHHMIIKGSAGFGLPNAKMAETDQRAIVGMSYSIGPID